LLDVGSFVRTLLPVDSRILGFHRLCLGLWKALSADLHLVEHSEGYGYLKVGVHLSKAQRGGWRELVARHHANVGVNVGIAEARTLLQLRILREPDLVCILEFGAISIGDTPTVKRSVREFSVSVS
jgi:hypothetical protein